MIFSVADREFMARALELARRGLFTTTPNPRVGCIIVRDGVMIGEGWHEMAGQPHAEINALAAVANNVAQKVGASGTAREDKAEARGEKGVARGATAYVTLEPCSHHGRTPPCADALIDAGIVRVVAAMRDPNPLVAGSGMARLELAGIDTASGLMEAEATDLNIGFVSRMTRGRPWLRLKVAASLDGKTALNNGKSQWITGPEARHHAHAWRARSCAMLTGIGTVRDDNPRLSVRGIDTPRQPLRVVVDSRLEIPLDAAVLDGAATGNATETATGNAAPVALIACAVAPAGKVAQLRARGVDVVVLPNAQGKVDLPALLRELGRRGINEVMVEAGFRLNASLLREDCVDELLIYQAPLLLGDKARGMFDLAELTELVGARRLDVLERHVVGTDFFLRARPT